MKARLGALAALLVVAAAVAACGGGGGGGLTKEEFIAQADAICTKTNEQQAAPGDVPSDPNALADYLEKQKGTAQDQVASLRALDAPEELKAKVDEAYGLLDQVVGKLDEAVAAARAGDIEKLTTVGTEAQRLSGQADAIADEIGLTVCGQGG